MAESQGLQILNLEPVFGHIICEGTELARICCPPKINLGPFVPALRILGHGNEARISRTCTRVLSSDQVAKLPLHRVTDDQDC